MIVVTQELVDPEQLSHDVDEVDELDDDVSEEEVVAQEVEPQALQLSRHQVLSAQQVPRQVLMPIY